MIRLLRANPAWMERVCLGSFSDARLIGARRRLGPALCTSTGPAGVLAHRMAAAVRRPTPTRYLGNCLQVPAAVGRLTVVTPAFVEAAHEQGRPVHVWTVDDPTEMERLLDLGVDGIMTDRPEILRSVLISTRPVVPTPLRVTKQARHAGVSAQNVTLSGVAPRMMRG